MVDAPERIWIEHGDECPYFYEKDELHEVGSAVTEYVRYSDYAALEAKLAERGKLFIAAAEEAYWLLAWTWQSHLTGPGKPFDMSIFTPEARNMMTNAERNLFDALSEIEP